jgi:hypothetical protein
MEVEGERVAVPEAVLVQAGRGRILLSRVSGVLPMQPEHGCPKIVDVSCHHAAKEETERRRTRQPGANDSKQRRDHPNTSPESHARSGATEELGAM